MAKFFQIIFYCACVLVRLTRQQEPDLLVEPLSVTALGRVALIGELYDARRDTFLGLSLLDTRLPNEFVYSTQNRHSDVRYLMLNTLEEKMSILNVKAETKLSLMWGLVQVSGSAKFFSDRKQTSKSVKISLANLVKTEYEQINLSGGTERRFIDLTVLGMIDATHVVVGIQWGGNVFISVEDSNTANRDQQAVQGSLSGKLQFLMNSISVNGSVEMDSEEINEYGKFSFELYGDILPTETPATLVDAVKLMKASSSMLTEGNSGKGKAMSYYLLPIQVFRELLSVETNVNTVLKSIDSVTIHSCIQLFEEMQLVEQKISELMLNRKTFDRYIVKEKLDSIVAMANAYDSYKTTITQRMAIQLKSVRSGSVSAATLLDTLRAARQDELSPNNIDFDKFSSVETEFRFLKLLSVSEATILPKDKPFEEFMSENFNVNIYAFFYTIEYPTLLHRPMSAFMSILEQRETFDPNGIFVAVKLDITGESERNVYFNFSEATRLRVYRNGICVADNYSENSDIEDGGSDPELWSFHYMQTQVSTLLDRSVKAQTEIVELAEETKKYFEKSVPIGFVYVQYPGMSTPSTIWPEFGWQSITANYANGFFRAEGSQSNTFGYSQDDNSPRITSIQVADDNSWDHQVYTSSGWTNWLGMAGKSGSWRTIRFHATGGEVRPFNYAIRIWKRNS